MKGLLLKDFYVMRKTHKYLLIIIMIYAFAALLGGGANIFWTFYVGMFAGMIPMTLYSFEERDGWGVYALTLPNTRARIAVEKYVLLVCITAAMTVLVGLVEAVRAVRTGDFSPESFVLILVLAVSSLTLPSIITLPFMYWLGAERGRIAYCAVIVLMVCVFNGAFLSWGGDGEEKTAIFSPGVSMLFDADGVKLELSMAILAVLAVLFLISLGVSVLIYKRREL